MEEIRVFDSFKHPEKCGCFVSLDQCRRSSCPKCGISIQFFQDVSKDDSDYVLFKHGKQYYQLYVRNKLSGGNVTAQERIAKVLDIPLDHMKIICRGKIVFPDQSKSSQAISEALISISRSDKPALLVMGTVYRYEGSRHLWQTVLASGKSVFLGTLSFMINFLKKIYGIVKPLLLGEPKR